MDTREKIFNAAMAAFAEQGYKKTTIRGICRLAGVNVAAVNYHFKGKAELYAKVFEYLFRKNPPEGAVNCGSLADRDCAKRYLREWVKGIFHFNRDNRIRSFKRKIMIHEMFEPSEIFPTLMERFIISDMTAVMQWLKCCCSADKSDRDIALVFFSMIAKCTFYVVHDGFVAMLMKDEDFIDKNLENIIDSVINETFMQLKCV